MVSLLHLSVVRCQLSVAKAACVTASDHHRRSTHDDGSAHLVDPSVSRSYHCVSRCVRRAFPLEEGPIDRKEWIEKRLEVLAGVFAVGVAGYSVMDNEICPWSVVRCKMPDAEPPSALAEPRAVRIWAFPTYQSRRWFSGSTSVQILS